MPNLGDRVGEGLKNVVKHANKFGQTASVASNGGCILETFGCITEHQGCEDINGDVSSGKVCDGVGGNPNALCNLVFALFVPM